MREQIESRLQSLMSEYKTGQEMLAEAEARQANLKITLARIGGAIQVLQELLQQNQPEMQETDADSMSKTSMAA